MSTVFLFAPPNNAQKSVEPNKKEFIELLKASGWTQREAAAELGMTESGVSQIVRENSSVVPSNMTMKFFKFLLAHKKPEVIGVKGETALVLNEDIKLNAKERELLEKLRALPVNQQASVIKGMLSIIETMPRVKTPRYRIVGDEEKNETDPEDRKGKVPRMGRTGN